MDVRLQVQRGICLAEQAIIQFFPCVFKFENLYSFLRARLEINRAHACSRQSPSTIQSVIQSLLIGCIVLIVWQRRHSGASEFCCILLYPPAKRAKHVTKRARLIAPRPFRVQQMMGDIIRRKLHFQHDHHVDHHVHSAYKVRREDSM